MKVFQLTETHPRVLLLNQLQSCEEKWYRANTVLKLISRRTETATSAGGPKLRGLLAENALAQPYLEQRILVLLRQEIDHYKSSSSSSTSPPMTSSTEIDHSDHHPAIVSSESVERHER